MFEVKPDVVKAFRQYRFLGYTIPEALKKARCDIDMRDSTTIYYFEKFLTNYFEK